VVVKDETGAWSAYAIELNLRKGGTTHPFLTAAVPHRRQLRRREWRFLTRQGVEKHLVATDHLEADDLRALSVDDLFDAVARHGLHFDQSSQTGVVFHMISSLSECGRVGMTAVGNSRPRRRWSSTSGHGTAFSRRRLTPVRSVGSPLGGGMQRLWYVAYGSNLSLERFRSTCRVAVRWAGLVSIQAAATHWARSGTCLDDPGGLRFVGVSSVWGGGMAVYARPVRSGTSRPGVPDQRGAVRGHLAQEMRLEPDLDADLGAVRETGWHSLGPGRYQTLAHVGDHDGLSDADFHQRRPRPPGQRTQ
jgi:hypothetical protein